MIVKCDCRTKISIPSANSVFKFVFMSEMCFGNAKVSVWRSFDIMLCVFVRQSIVG